MRAYSIESGKSYFDPIRKRQTQKSLRLGGFNLHYRR